jgi:hypothetical protein
MVGRRGVLVAGGGVIVAGGGVNVAGCGAAAGAAQAASQSKVNPDLIKGMSLGFIVFPPFEFRRRMVTTNKNGEIITHDYFPEKSHNFIIDNLMVLSIYCTQIRTKVRTNLPEPVIARRFVPKQSHIRLSTSLLRCKEDTCGSQ